MVKKRNANPTNILYVDAHPVHVIYNGLGSREKRRLLNVILFFPEGLRVIVTVHINMLHTIVLNWTVGVAQRSINLSYLANMIKEWQAEDSHDHINQVSLFPFQNLLRS